MPRSCGPRRSGSAGLAVGTASPADPDRRVRNEALSEHAMLLVASCLSVSKCLRVEAEFMRLGYPENMRNCQVMEVKIKHLERKSCNLEMRGEVKIDMIMFHSPV